MKKELWKTCAVTWLILSSGAPYYMKYNMLLCMIIMSVIAVWGMIKYRCFTISKRIFKSVLVYSFFVFISIFLSGTDGLILNEVLIIFGRLFFLMALCSCIQKEEFYAEYINIMYLISIISIVCFSIMKMWPDTHLPFEMNVSEINWHGTFYYTLGFFNNTTYRNAGVFGEGGVFQIFTNIALFLSIHCEERGKKRTRHIVVFLIATFTTLSTMGFLSMFFVIVSVLYKNRAKMKYYCLTFLVIVAIVIIDFNTGTLSDKLLNQGGSFGSRYDDFIVSWLVTMEKPIMGYGIANTDYLDSFMLNETTNLRMTNPVFVHLQRSNGLGLLMMRCGLLYTMYFIWRLYAFSKNNIVKNRFHAAIFAMVLLMGVFNEPIGQTTIYMLFFFDFSNNYYEKSGLFFVKKYRPRVCLYGYIEK